MRALATAAVLGGVLACRGSSAPLYPGGSSYDEGHGDLALASMKLLTAAPPEQEGAARRGSAAEPAIDDADGADAADPAAERPGDAAYGGSTYASFIVPTWHPVSVDRRPR